MVAKWAISSNKPRVVNIEVVKHCSAEKSPIFGLFLFVRFIRDEKASLWRRIAFDSFTNVIWV